MELLYTDNRIVVCLKPAGVLSTDEPGGMPELLRRALGYQSKEIYSEEIVDSETGEVIKQLKRRTVVKTVPPDVRAALLWLQNHRPDVWGSGSGASDIDGLLSGMDPEASDLL